jgi:hypothetical protein
VKIMPLPESLYGAAVQLWQDDSEFAADRGAASADHEG